MVDIRPADQRERDGCLPGARVIPRNVLEWRLDPRCEHRDPDVARADRQVIVVCDEGYQSSLAAATLRRLGLDATDVIGGVQSWRAEGLPLGPGADGRGSQEPACGRGQVREQELLALTGRRAVLLEMRRDEFGAVADGRRERIGAVAGDRQAAAAGRAVRAEGAPGSRVRAARHYARATPGTRAGPRL